MKVLYPAVFRRNLKGSVDIIFPGVEGLTGTVSQVEDGPDKAKEILKSYLDGAERLPEARKLSEVKTKPGEYKTYVAYERL